MKLALLMCVLLSGCANIPELVKARHVDETGIRWVRGVAEDCAGVKRPEGCADWSTNPCVITMKEDAPDAIVAHELRHCFGYIHKRGDGG